MNIEEKVIAIIRKNLEKPREVALASNLRTELCLDSFGTLMIVNEFEDTFGITVDDGDFAKMETVADAVKLLREKYHCPETV